MQSTMTLVRKSLFRLVSEAALSQGRKFETRVNNLNCLEYVLDGVVMTPGQAADALGIVWE